MPQMRKVCRLRFRQDGGLPDQGSQRSITQVQIQKPYRLSHQGSRADHRRAGVQQIKQYNCLFAVPRLFFLAGHAMSDVLPIQLLSCNQQTTDNQCLKMSQRLPLKKTASFLALCDALFSSGKGIHYVCVPLSLFQRRNHLYRCSR